MGMPSKEGWEHMARMAAHITRIESFQTRLDSAHQSHLAARDAYTQAKANGCRKAVVIARRAMRDAAKNLIDVTYAAGLEPSEFIPGARPYMYRPHP